MFFWKDRIPRFTLEIFHKDGQLCLKNNQESIVMGFAYSKKHNFKGPFKMCMWWNWSV